MKVKTFDEFQDVTKEIKHPVDMNMPMPKNIFHHMPFGDL